MMYPEFDPQKHVIPNRPGGKTRAAIKKILPGTLVVCPNEISAARMRQLLDDAGKKMVEVAVLPETDTENP